VLGDVPTTTSGISEEHATITTMMSNIHLHLNNRPSIIAERNRCLHEIRTVFLACSNEGWDGYGAQPVSKAACYHAEMLLTSFPAFLPFPTVSAEPDGHLTFEWYINPSRLLNVSISPNAELHYAALLSTNEVISGSCSCHGAMPKELLNIIAAIFSP
jgi:hypothetical protein